MSRESSRSLPAIVIGAGPAGLAVSRALGLRGVGHLVLERGERVGESWANAYDSLRLHTGRHMSSLPGMRFPGGTPLFPSRGEFVEYLKQYAETFSLPVRTGSRVVSVTPQNGFWRVTATDEQFDARAVVMATGIMSNPREPELPGRERFAGRVMHSVRYRKPASFTGHRVLVIGVGNSGGEIASELSAHGADVTIAVRSGANVVPRELLGVPIQYLSYLVRQLPRAAQEVVVAAIGRITELRRGPPVLPRPAHSALDAIPLIGFNLVDAIRAGRIEVRGGVTSLTETGARFADGVEEPFEDVILATGFAPALGPLGSQVRTDAKGFALRDGRVRSADHASLFFVGHNYDATGAIFNIAKDAPVAAEGVRAVVR